MALQCKNLVSCRRLTVMKFFYIFLVFLHSCIYSLLSYTYSILHSCLGCGLTYISCLNTRLNPIPLFSLYYASVGKRKKLLTFFFGFFDSLIKNGLHISSHLLHNFDVLYSFIKYTS